MTFDYLQIITSMDSIDILDIGNTALKVNNDEGEYYVLKISTSLGWSTIKIFGPLSVDSNDYSYVFNYNYQKFEYNRKTIIKIITKFLNRDGITQAVEISMDEVDKLLKELNI